ncbi:MAG: DUF2064 domain-containing protein, partial [Frankiaceae bacterium]|nr:DUF2064 domain-containing protein [Frankiaceae bacterium]
VHTNGWPASLDPRTERVRGDVRDAATVDRALDGIDAVCHQAAMVGLGVDLQNLPLYVGHNDLGTAVLLAAMDRSRVKTRLSPPFTSQGGADVAEAALLDTLETVRAIDVAHRVLVLEGDYPAPGFDVQPQRGGPMDERLGAAFDDAAETAPGLPTLLVGMDTPQLARLRAAGLDPHLLPELLDVDTIADAREVAALVPHGRFAAAVGTLAS